MKLVGSNQVAHVQDIASNGFYTSSIHPSIQSNRYAILLLVTVELLLQLVKKKFTSMLYPYCFRVKI